MKGFDPRSYEPNVEYRHYWGMDHLFRVDAKCTDNMVRRATVTAEADTYFSTPARVQVRGKSISGFLTTTDHYNLPEDGNRAVYEFIQYSYGKNGDMLPAPRFDR
jgi:hypothetical protein